MATNLALDDTLVAEAKELGGYRTKREAVNAALEEYVRHRKQLKVLDLFGQIEWEEDYDILRERQREKERIILRGAEECP